MLNILTLIVIRVTVHRQSQPFCVHALNDDLDTIQGGEVHLTQKKQDIFMSMELHG